VPDSSIVPSPAAFADRLAAAATYPWVVIALTALAAFVGAAVAQVLQLRRDKARRERQMKREDAVRLDERERERLASLREDRRRFVAESRAVYERFLAAVHELDTEITYLPLSAEDRSSLFQSDVARAAKAVSQLMKARAALELFGSDDVYKATAEVSVELLKAFREKAYRSESDVADGHIEAARAAQVRLVELMRETLHGDSPAGVEAE
jgi:hypothetical protein